jgi:phage terminase large subunit
VSGPAQIEPWMRAWSASRDNPWLFVTGVIGVLPYGAPNPNKEPQLEKWQDEELRNVVAKRRISIRAGHGIGKSTFLAWIVLWGICTHDDVKIPVASNSQNQLRDVIWPEIFKWWRRLPEPLKSQVDVQTERVVVKAAPDSAFAVARTAAKENSEALQGFHAGLVIFLIDEASGVADVIFEVAWVPCLASTLSRS